MSLANISIDILHYRLLCTAVPFFLTILYVSSDDKTTMTALIGNSSSGHVQGDVNTRSLHCPVIPASGLRHGLAKYAHPISCSTDLAVWNGIATRDEWVQMYEEENSSFVTSSRNVYVVTEHHDWQKMDQCRWYCA